MKQSSSIGSDRVNDRTVFHLLFFFALSLGLFFGPQSPLLASINEDGHFLEATQISASNSILSDSNALESAKVENEEKEEKEEKESESETDGSDIYFAAAGKAVPISILGGGLTDTNRQFLSYPKVKLYLLFHCLKSDLA